MPPQHDDLEPLRAEIAEVDGAIAAGIARRLVLAREVAAAKARRQQPTRDYEVESRVLARWRDALAPSGVTPGRAASLARWLVEESVRVQEERRPTPGGGSAGAQRIAIVGGAGAMGRWLADFFEDSGHHVVVVDPRTDTTSRERCPDVRTAVASSDVVVFATPIRATSPLLEEALGSEGGALIFDVLSVKEPVAAALRAGARAGKRVTSVHPMFGPSARTLSGRNLLLVSCGVPEADRAARALFAGSALSVVEVPLDRHDLLIAESLGLAHAVNLLFLAALADDPATPHELARTASTTFHRQSSLARSVAAEGPELYLDIQATNPHSQEMYRDLGRALERLARIVDARDSGEFADLLSRGAAKLDPGAEAMRA